MTKQLLTFPAKGQSNGQRYTQITEASRVRNNAAKGSNALCMRFVTIFVQSHYCFQRLDLRFAYTIP